MDLQHTPFIKKQFSGSNLQGKMTVCTVVKASYDFNNTGILKIADHQEAIITHDQFRQDPKHSSILYAEESMPFKQGSELLLIGSFEPQLPCSQQIITLKLKHGSQQWQKSLTVFGKRYWQTTLIGAKKTEPIAFSEPIELSYELAFGGNTYPANPVGKGFTDNRFKFEGIELPQIEYTDALIRSPRNRPYVAGFNAIAKHWQPRLSEHAQINLTERILNSPTIHNLAPLDQQFEKSFEGEETLCISGWSHSSLLQKSLILSIPKPVKNENKILYWDTAIVNIDTNKLFLLTRY